MWMAEAGDVVVCDALDSRPPTLVIGAAAECVEVVLLAYLPRALIHRCRRGDGTAVVGEAPRVDQCSRYWVPREDIELEPAFQTRQ
jgi:hypothetical protein